MVQYISIHSSDWKQVQILFNSKRGIMLRIKVVGTITLVAALVYYSALTIMFYAHTLFREAIFLIE